MKKLMALLLALMMMGCAALGEAADYAGTWVLTMLETPEMKMDMALLKQLGMGMTMTLNEDGTMYTDTMGVKEEGTWVVTETGIAITDDEETLQIAYVNDMLRIEDDGAAMLLTREGAAEEAAPAETSAEGVDFVAGYWVLDSVQVMGFTMDAEAMQMQAYMELYDDGTCLLVQDEEMQYGTWTKTETGLTTTDANGEVDVYTYVDGNLVVEAEGSKFIFTPETYTVPLSGLTAADFEGDWVFNYVEVGNTSYYPEEVGMYMTLSIQDGQGVHTMTFKDEAGETTEVYNGVCQIEEIPDFGTAMYLLYTDEAGQTDGSGVMLLKFDNSELVWYAVDENDNNVFYCFVPEALLEE